MAIVSTKGLAPSYISVAGRKRELVPPPPPPFYKQKCKGLMKDFYACGVG